MSGRPPRKVLLVVAMVLFAILATAALTQIAALILLGVLVAIVMLWLEGYVRFPRVRRFFRSIGQGLWQFVRTRRMSKRSLRSIGIAFGVLLAIVLFNQLQLKAPGEGRGLSVPTEALSLNFGGINSPGEWIASGIAYALIAALLGLGWFRIWQEVTNAGGLWRRRVYVACIAGFFLLPILFALAMATMAPQDPEDNVEFSKVMLRTVGVGMALAFSAAIAVPFIGDEQRQPIPIAPPPPVVPTYVPFAPTNRSR